MGRHRSSMCAASTASSARLAGRIAFARREVPAPAMRHGLKEIRSSRHAVMRIVRSRPQR